MAGFLAAGEAPVPPTRLGQIFIEGNFVTKQHIILERMALYPGQLLSFGDIQASLKNLGWLRFLGIIDATVTVLDPEGESPYKDIVVNVQETPLTEVTAPFYDTVMTGVELALFCNKAAALSHATRSSALIGVSLALLDSLLRELL